MDHHMIAKFFKGLAAAGAWCCFDEFNRINIEVLSVIAQQLLVLFGAKQALTSYSMSAQLEFEGTPIIMRPTFNVFITMNPGYADRTELPDNLAALFRPMAMMVPDYGMIGEIMFYAFGFEGGRALARKMVTTFKLASEQLSSQCHYDYGMRAVKTVIEAAGLNKQLFPDQTENQILLRALQDVNVPKFLRDDLPLFANIILDLFPGIEDAVIDRSALLGAITDVCKEMNIQDVEFFATKNIELYDMIQVRHGMMLVGPTGGGKTACMKCLQGALTLLSKTYPDKYQAVHTHILNPKAITQAQIYGAFDEMTHEWSDGIGAAQGRVAVKQADSPDSQWVYFDGPVDALWIESMNTVLDDNKKLCLVSGEIISLTAQMRMQFEVEDLEVASPATVSRCGMIYLEPESLGNQVLKDTWYATFPETFDFQPSIREKIVTFCDDFLEQGFFFVRKRCKEVAATCDNNLCQSFFRLMNCYFEQYRPTEVKLKNAFKAEIEQLAGVIGPLLVFVYLWTVGGALEGASRSKFSDYVMQSLLGTAPTEQQDDLVWFPKHHTEISREGLPDEGPNLFDFCFDPTVGKWLPWMETVPEFTIKTGTAYENIVVPSVNSVRQTFISKKLIEGCGGIHVLCAGPTGTGKSVNLSLYLQKNAPANYMSVFINFSAQTHVNQLQDLIDSKVEKRRRGVFGPPAGRKMVLFVDDLNMPQKEFYGAQPPLELLRQWHDHKGWYNRKELTKFEIVDVIMVSCMGPPGGGRTFITPRIKRHYNMVAYADFL